MFPENEIKTGLISYEVNKKGVSGICKQPAIWGMFSDGKNEHIAPLVYLQKPKWMTNKQFTKILDAITLFIALGVEL